jgi:NADP-dependent 3-hydroxy acid dehydrogenase YdfG
VIRNSSPRRLSGDSNTYQFVVRLVIEMTGITGKVVTITGASSGIGEATARLLAENGAKVVLGARRTERLDDIAREIRDGGGVANTCRTDVARSEDLERLVGMAVDDFDHLDVLVSNAGISKIGPISDLDVDGWSAMIDVNLRGVLHGIAAALPVFRRQGRGHFVTTVSTSGLKIVPTMAVYAATKNAVRTIMEGLRQESTDGVVQTTSISPGFVDTQLDSSIDDSALREQIRRTMTDFGLPAAAVARAIVFAIEQPDHAEIGDITIRPTAQG